MLSYHNSIHSTEEEDENDDDDDDDDDNRVDECISISMANEVFNVHHNTIRINDSTSLQLKTSPVSYNKIILSLSLPFFLSPSHYCKCSWFLSYHTIPYSCVCSVLFKL